MVFKKSTSGFSYLELLLYVAILIVVMGAIIPFSWNIILTGQKSSVQQEVDSQARYLSDRLNREIRYATGINSSSFDLNLASNSSYNLSLIQNSPNNPTIINVVGGRVQITQGTNPAAYLTSEATRITSLIFTNRTTGGGLTGVTKHIDYSFTIEYNSPTDSSQNYKSSVTIQSGAEIRID